MTCNNIFVFAINNLLLWISCSNRLLFHEFYCNRLQIINKNNLDQVIAMIFFIVMNNCLIFFITIDCKIIDIRLL